MSRTMVDILLEQGHPVRAFVRQDDERAHSLRQAGAEAFVGDLLTIADVTAALKGVRRIYFSMSLSKPVRWALGNHPRIRKLAAA
nr:NAD(P)H-binding protein [Streptomyces sp. 846.5]